MAGSGDVPNLTQTVAVAGTVTRSDMSRAQRMFDLVGALAGLAVFAPAMAVIAVAVLIDDGRPVLFRQERVGYQRRPFHILKFRSMRAGRVTRVGRLLRATGLDELPQFVNILRGHMSAVGPRPLTPRTWPVSAGAGPNSTFAGRAALGSRGWRSRRGSRG